ncbi:MAG: hypothetical protein K2N69_04955, partial [Helicobacter sp.]|nr:hypothetical protein [Helicobacter sp.]
MRQRYAYGSNIAAVRCGWEDRIMSNSKLTDCGIQSGAVLWLRHSFARAFSSDSIEAIYLSLREALASWQSIVYEARIMGILCLLIASAIASQ